MADQTEMNAQVTDAVTQANVLAGGSASAHALGQSYQTMAHSTGLSFQNTVATQQQSTLHSNTEAVLLTQHLLALGTAESGAMASSFGTDPLATLRPLPQRRTRRPGRRAGSRP